MNQNKVNLVSFLLFISFPFLSFCQWNKLNHPSDNYITNVNYLNQNDLVISGADGLIKSFDGGFTWRVDKLMSLENRLYPGSVAYELTYISDTEVFLSGMIYTNNDALILKSTNSGINWGMKYWAPDGNWPRKFNQLKEINGTYFAVGSNGMVITSSNKGESWVTRPTLSNYDLVDLEMLDEQTLISVCDEGIARSTNGGYSWKLTEFEGVEFRSLTKVNKNKLVAGADQGIYISEDGGKTWILGLDRNTLLNRVEVAPGGRIYACVNGGVFVSEDGFNWGLEDLPDSCNYVGISFYDNKNGVVVSDKQCFITSSGGKIKPIANMAISETTLCADSIIHFSSSSGFVDSYTWKFNDVVVNTNASFDYVFDQSQSGTNYKVELIVSLNGISDTTSEDIEVQMGLNPIVNYSINTTNVCPGQKLSLSVTDKTSDGLFALKDARTTRLMDSERYGPEFTLESFQLYEGDSLNLHITESNECGTKEDIIKFNKVTFQPEYDELKWKEIDLDSETNGIISIQVVDENTIFAFSQDEILIKSSNKGKSWEFIELYRRGGSWDGNISFVNKDVGFVANGNLYRTKDGGQTLEKINYLNNSFNGVEAVNENEIFAFSYHSSSDLAHLSKSNDGGDTWHSVLSLNSEYRFSDLECPTGDTCYASGQKGFLFRSIDRGENWDTIVFNSGSLNQFSTLRNLSFLNGHIGYASNGGNIVKTNDAGLTWENKGHFYYQNYSISIRDIKVINENEAYVVGNRGTHWYPVKPKLEGGVYKTFNGGDCWQLISPLKYVPNEIDFFGNFGALALEKLSSRFHPGNIAVTNYDDYPAFSSLDTNLCIGETTYFKNESNGFSDFQWLIGDSIFSTSINAEITIQELGDFEIRLVGTKEGKRDTSETFHITSYGSTVTTITEQIEDKWFCLDDWQSMRIEVEGTDLSFNWQTSYGNGFIDSTLARDLNYIENSFGFDKGTNALDSFPVRCVVSGRCALDVISDTAYFKLADVTKIINQPISDTVCSGDTAQISISASGTNLTYSWQRQLYSGSYYRIDADDPYLDFNTEKLLVPNMSSSLNGKSFKIEVKGECGTVFSDIAYTHLGANSRVEEGPKDASVCPKEGVVFNAEISGTYDKLIWQIDTSGVFEYLDTNDNFIGNNSKTLTIKDVKSLNQAKFKLVSQGGCIGNSETNSAIITIQEPLILDSVDITFQCFPGNIVGESSYQGGYSPRFHWAIDSLGFFETIGGNTNVYIPHRKSLQGNIIRLVAQECGVFDTTYSRPIGLDEKPIILDIDMPESACEGDTFDISVKTESWNDNYSYSWRGKLNKYSYNLQDLSEGIKYQNVKDSSLIISGFSDSHSKVYSVYITNNGCGVESDEMSLNMLRKPYNSSPRADYSICRLPGEIQLKTYISFVDSIDWRSSGTGSFSPNKNATWPYYELTNNDLQNDSLTFIVDGFSDCGVIISDTFVVVLDICTSTEEISENSLSFFPNPASKYLKISGIMENSSLIFYDKTGRILFKKDNISSGDQLNIEKYPQGIYFIRVTDSKNQFSTLRRIVKTK